jgi:peptide/nickel transport system permease protein
MPGRGSAGRLAGSLGHALLTLVVVSLLAFGLSDLNPTERTRALLEGRGLDVITAQDEAELRQELGLDRPMPERYLGWLRGLAAGDLGVSHASRRPVAEMVGERVGPTFLMAGLALALAVAVAVPLGVTAARLGPGPGDAGIQVFAVAAASLPSFWLGYVLILLFSVRLGWLPAFGLRGPAHLVLPAVVLATPLIALLTRLVRTATLDALSQDWVRAARAKGLAEGTILARHAAPAIALPVLAVLGVEFAGLLTGSAILEVVFAWPGLGRLVVDAVAVSDTPVIAAFMLLSAATFAALNVVVALLSHLLDPRR